MNPQIDMVDIGVNLAHRRLRPDLEQVVARARAAGVKRMVATGTSLAASREAQALCQRYPGEVFATAGVHPNNARECDEHTPAALRELAQLPGVVAIGECGLDYDRDFSPRPAQRACFQAQLALAHALKRPVFLHERAAHADFAAMLREHAAGLELVVHCFTGGADELDAYLELGAHIGITGWICDDRRGAHLRELLPKIPRDRLMIETDAPFLLPKNAAPRTKDRRNEPAFLRYVLSAVALSLGEPEHEVAARTTANAMRFFKLS